MLDKIENLKAQMQGHELNIRQRADALIEFNKLLEYTEELESKVKNSRVHDVMPCGDCSTKTSPCRSINCQYSKVHKT
jgi:hypothetical protein